MEYSIFNGYRVVRKAYGKVIWMRVDDLLASLLNSREILGSIYPETSKYCLVRLFGCEFENIMKPVPLRATIFPFPKHPRVAGIS